MNKIHLALTALCACAGAASAQSNVTIYGIADVGIVAERGGSGGSTTKVTSGVASGSRLGFRGSEDLGGGLSAQFVLESGINMDTGQMTGGLLFGRQASVGLKGGFGAVNMGRQYTPYWSVLVGVDPFSAGLAGKANNLMANSGVRMNNSVRYSSPKMGGFTADLAHGFGEVPGSLSKSRVIGANFRYAAGPITAGLGYHRANNAANTDRSRNTLLAGTYDFGAAKAHLAYAVNKGMGSADNRDLMVGVTVPFGANKLMASLVRKDDKSAANRDAQQWGVGYVHSLSKRTNLYVAYAKISNKNGATFTVGNGTEPGSGDSAFNLGMRHSF